MMPTEVMAGTVAVSTYRCAQPHYFGNELSASHESEIVIRHAISLHPPRRLLGTVSPVGTDDRTAIRHRDTHTPG